MLTPNRYYLADQTWFTSTNPLNQNKAIHPHCKGVFPDVGQCRSWAVGDDTIVDIWGDIASGFMRWLMHSPLVMHWWLGMWALGCSLHARPERDTTHGSLDTCAMLANWLPDSMRPMSVKTFSPSLSCMTWYHNRAGSDWQQLPYAHRISESRPGFPHVEACLGRYVAGGWGNSTHDGGMQFQIVDIA